MKHRRPTPLGPAATASNDPPCLRLERDGACSLDVSVSPNAKRTEVLGLHDGALRIRLAAPPVDGQANAELVRWLAAELGLAQRAVELLRGQASRRKQLRVDAEPDAVRAWLRSVLATAG